MKLLDKIIIAILILCVVAVLQFVYNNREDTCVSNPLSYGAAKMEEVYGYPFIGRGSFIRKGGEPIIIGFDRFGIDFLED